MKVDTTKSGNIKMVMTLREAEHLRSILNVSHLLSEDYDYPDETENVSQELWNILDESF